LFLFIHRKPFNSSIAFLLLFICLPFNSPCQLSLELNLIQINAEHHLESGKAYVTCHFIDSIGQEFTLVEILPIEVDSTIAHYFPYEAAEVLIHDTMILYLGEKYTFSIYPNESNTSDVDKIILRSNNASYTVDKIDGYFRTIDGFTRYVHFVKFSASQKKIDRLYHDPKRWRKAKKWLRKNR
jgi:hypothetical protein